VAQADLESAYARGHLEFVPLLEGNSTGASAPPWTRPADLSQLSPNVQKEIRRRETYIKAVRKVDELRWDPALVGPILEATAKSLNEPKPPHPSTVRVWHGRYVKSDGDLLSLMPRTERRGCRVRRLQREVIDLIDKAIARYYMSETRHSGVRVWHCVVDEVNQANAKRQPAQALTAPSRRTVHEAIAKLDKYEVCVARYGKRYADRKFAQTGKMTRPTRPLERVEIDHTKADLMVVDDQHNLPIGRPWVTAAIDVYTRMIVGVHVGFTPPSLVSVMRCLRHMILPKSDLKTQYPGIRNDWPCFGPPEGIVCDKGKEFMSMAFKEAVGQFGTEVIECDVRNPNQKGGIERIFGTANTDLLHHQPGTTFSNLMDRADYDPVKNAVISLSAFKGILFKWICDVYHVDFHRGLSGVPLTVWNREAAAHPPRGLPRHVDDLVVLFGRGEERTIHHYGVEFLGLQFNAPELTALRTQMAKRQALVRIDEEDLGQVHVYDEVNRRYVAAPCVEPKYAMGLSVWQHRVIRRYLLEQGVSTFDLAALVRAKGEIQEMVEAEWARTKRTGHRQRMARFLGDKTGARIEVTTGSVVPPSPAVDVLPASPADVAAEDVHIERMSGEGWGVESNHVH
jgi:putative transposase